MSHLVINKLVQDLPGRHRAVKQQSLAGRRVRVSSSPEDAVNDAPQEHSPPQSALVLSPAQSQLALVATAVLWGTNPVCLRSVPRHDGKPDSSLQAPEFVTCSGRYLDLSQQPPSPALVTSAQSAVAALWLGALGWALDVTQAGQAQRSEPDAEYPEPVTRHQRDDSPRILDDGLQKGLTSSSPWKGLQSSGLLAAAELGCWMFGANAATVIAFQQTSASRGAFLIRLTAVFTPFVALAAGQRSSRRVWLGSALAFIGGLLISFGRQDSTSAFGAVSAGDLTMIGAALLWSCQTVRLGQQANRHSVQRLAVGQMTVNAALCTSWWVWDTAASSQPWLAEGLGPEWQDPWRWAALLWPAFGPWGLGSLLQLAGQQSVSAARTQIILASDPVWATIFATLILGSNEQQLGTFGWAGSALILTASLTSRED